MIVPYPQRMTRRGGCFRLTADTTLRADEASSLAGAALRRDLGVATGFALAAESGEARRSPGEPTTSIRLAVKDRLGPEAYRMAVGPELVEISGGDAAGVFYGVQSLRQLLPADAFAPSRVDRIWEIPCVEIEDWPRYGWRGAMLDVARHFMPKQFVLRFLDLLAWHKLNVAHLHLTDDQGWRIEIPAYPRLTEVAAWRAETLIGSHRGPEGERRYDGTRYGGFYTQHDLRDIVAYAAERHITVVPEIDMPGHMQAVVAAYPELGNAPGRVPVRTDWGISPHVLDPVAGLDFCRTVLASVVGLFPSRFIHCGGDEVPKDEWRTSARVREQVTRLGLGDEEALQGWLTTEIATFLAERGRRMVGWDEVLRGFPGATIRESASEVVDLAGVTAAGRNALRSFREVDPVVMSWNKDNPGIQAAEAGFDVVMTPRTHTYFNYSQEEGDTSLDPLEPSDRGITLAQAYAYDPVPDQLDAEAARHVLGSQCQLWTAYVPTPERAEYLLLPRLCAFAEKVWRDHPDSFDRFCTRLRPHLTRLDTAGIRYRTLD